MSKIKKITVMGIDPATETYGVTLLTVYVKGKKTKYRIKHSGFIKSTIKDLKGDVENDLIAYVSELKTLLDSYKVNHVMVERYMSRGRFGVTIECVNQMIGAMYFLFPPYGIDIVQIPAVTWKNRCNKFFVLDKPKKGVTKDGPSMYQEANKSKVPNHLVDSTFQAIYRAEQVLGIDLISQFESKKARTKLVKRIANAMPTNAD